jgi:hypothetical protein
VGLQRLAWWDCGLDSSRGHRYLSIVSVVSGQAEIFELVWSIVQRGPKDCHVFEWVRLTLKKFPWNSEQHIHVTHCNWKYYRAVAGGCISKIIVRVLWKKDVTLFILNLAKYIPHIICAKREWKKWKHRL